MTNWTGNSKVEVIDETKKCLQDTFKIHRQGRKCHKKKNTKIKEQKTVIGIKRTDNILLC